MRNCHVKLNYDCYCIKNKHVLTNGLWNKNMQNIIPLNMQLTQTLKCCNFEKRHFLTLMMCQTCMTSMNGQKRNPNSGSKSLKYLLFKCSTDHTANHTGLEQDEGQQMITKTVLNLIFGWAIPSWIVSSGSHPLQFCCPSPASCR